MVTSLTSVLRTVCTLLYYYVVTRLSLLRVLAHALPHYQRMTLTITLPYLAYIYSFPSTPLYSFLSSLFLILFYRGSFKPRQFYIISIYYRFSTDFIHFRLTIAYGIGRNIALFFWINEQIFSEIGIILSNQYKFMNSALNTKYSTIK